MDTQQDTPTFLARDYGDRTPPDNAVILEEGEEPDTTVYAWPDSDVEADVNGIWLQQGYDMIHLPGDAIAALHAFARAAAREEV